MKQISLLALQFLFTCILAAAPMAARAGREALSAGDFFKQGKFEEALEYWYGVASVGQYNAALYYNIGLAESQLKHTAEAMLAFEQAHRLAPGDEVVLSAIADERKRIENATIPVDAFFLSAGYKIFVTFFRPGSWALIGLGFLAGGLFLIFRKNKQLPVKFQMNDQMGVYIAVMGLLFVVLGYLSYRALYRDDEAIVFVRCEMHQAPSDDSPQVRTLSPGEKIVITDGVGEWYNVQLLNLDQGWIKSNSFTSIRIGRK